MKKTLGKLLIIAGIVILACFIYDGVRGFSFIGFNQESVHTASASPKKVNKIDISAKSITVNIKAEQRDDIDAELSGNARLESSEKGDTLQLSVHPKPFQFFFFQKNELIVRIPYEYKDDLSITSGSGNVNISGGHLHLKKVALSSGSGSQKVNQLQAEQLEVKGTSGNIRLKDVRTAEADIRSTSGNTKLEDVTGKLNIKQTSGNAKLDLPDDADISLEAVSTSGNISYSYSFDQISSEKRTLTGKNGNGQNKIDISLTSGNVSIE
ncbi:DUF4097 domain-containing protein [Bacillus swezeyi]|uniref:Protein LiaG n=1 Tax=Bacillus swezeyi TaxID=1925020 RepID=A0A1R1RZY8_9BACI|nr:DUF4097 domain-containing protein [Bacillus swezeyi]MEC1259661.1 DUF4097 domain-containing protein [Bacillus swezeyi]MED2927376.1 DUF4097 domain-containing protein [Bacillus swezeyi]MED2962574.1 DUF4097 domain-containing protein [Bacillus swezeyi]MED3071971.1 DUF4097 domain-containing protein [Bacillus swezeyi]MED3082856.1 DUF4097 domain-containing protein [Bacillus swezeyi]